MSKLSEDDIVEVLYERMKDLPGVEVFIETPRESVAAQYFNLGQSIRNEFKLWTRKWKSKMINRMDYSEDHPDAVSARIIEKLQDKLNTI
jgi:hypothetical protein